MALERLEIATPQAVYLLCTELVAQRHPREGVVRGGAAERLIAGLLRTGHGGPVRRAFAALTASPRGAEQSDEQVLRWFSRALGGEHASVGGVRVLGVPIKLSETPGAVTTAPPTLGQHTDQILRTDLGLTDVDVASLRTAGTI